MTEATKGVIVWLLSRMENLEHELLAHPIVIEAVKSGLPAAGVAEVLQAARQSTDANADLDVKYQSTRERFFELVNDAGVDQARPLLLGKLGVMARRGDARLPPLSACRAAVF